MLFGKGRSSWLLGLFLTVTVAAISIASCSGMPSDPVSSLVAITTTRSTYAPGDEIEFLVENRSTENVVEDLCAGDLEHWNGERWEGIIGRACTLPRGDSSRTIEPGTKARSSFPTATTYPTGRYRVMLHITDEAGAVLPREERISNLFRLEE